MSFLPVDVYREVVRHAPIIAIDLLVFDPKGHVLLGRRKNSPAKDFLFVPGGRVFKNEPMAAALKRLVKEELGVELQGSEASLFGVFDHFYPDNPFADPSFDSHYIILATRLTLDLPIESLPTGQHNEYVYMNPKEVLSSTEVHDLTKRYFVHSPDNLYLWGAGR